MSTRRLISCINQQERHNPHERIINVGGVFAGERWKYSQAEAVAYTERGVYSFYVNVDGFIVDVIIARYMGNKYLKSQFDTSGIDTLFTLPECPLD
jgi:hypothetical protein